VDDPYLEGHFPGLTLYPGVFLLESVGQAVAAAFAGTDARPPTLRMVDGLRCLAPLLDGDEFSVDVGITGDGPAAVRVRAVFRRQDGVRAATVQAVYDRHGRVPEGGAR
jgi:3-hydroxymyristoyl/3-hydroxydecanoyl-(acyl carrier protein) dehydratase